MGLSVGKLFGVLAQDDCRRALIHLLNSAEPQTQGQLSAVLGLRSSVISRRMKEVEEVGLVTRASGHAPYEILFSAQLRDVMTRGADLARDVSRRQAEKDDDFARDLRKGGMRGGSLLDEAREGG